LETERQGIPNIAEEQFEKWRTPEGLGAQEVARILAELASTESVWASRLAHEVVCTLGSVRQRDAFRRSDLSLLSNILEIFSNIEVDA